MDRTALNYANLFGYQAALGLKGQQFNYLSASELPLPSKGYPGSKSQLTDGSGLCWALLLSISMWVAYRAISRSESHRLQHPALGGYGPYSVTVPDIFDRL